MTHFTREHPDAGYYRGFVGAGGELATILRNIDEKTARAVSGDDGGTWAPGAPLQIGGAGVVLAGPSVLEGPGVVASAPITFAKGTDDDFFALGEGHPLRTQVLVTPLLEAFTERVDETVFGSAGLWSGTITRKPGVRFSSPLRVYDGAILAKLIVRFAVGMAHASVPQTMPRVRVIAVDDVGTVRPLRAPDASTDAEGFHAIPAPLSGAAWFAAGAVQTFAYLCNQSATIDIARHQYLVEIIDESGANVWTTTGNVFISAEATFTSITRLDGRT